MREAGARLGRGLASLLGESSLAPSDQLPQTVGDVELDLLDTNPFQPRASIAPETLTELSASIARQGILQPLLVRPHPTVAGRFQIIAGERRWRAARQAGLATVPCYIRPLDDATVTAAALVENLQRRDLNPIEEAAGYHRLIAEFAMTQEHLSTAIGKSRSHVANMLRLLQLPDSVKGHLQTGSLSAGHARAALAADDPAAAAEAMIANGLNVRQAEALTAAPSLRPSKGRASTRYTSHPDLKAVESDLAESLGMMVSISFDGQGGTLKLRYQTLDQLDHLIGVLGAKR